MAATERYAAPASRSTYMGADDLYNILRSEILTLKLMPGQLVSENSISHRFGVSRTPVRSCFERLHQDGFLEVIPKKGTYVTLIDLDLAEQIIYMRVQVETSAMTYLAEHPDRMLFERLHRNLEQQKVQLELGVVDNDFYKLDSQFHEQCLVAIDKADLWNMIQNMEVQYSRYRHLDYISTRKFQDLYTEHCNLLRFMEDGCVEKIRPTVTLHLYGGFLRFGTQFVLAHQDYFKDSRRDINEILLCIKKQLHESGVRRNP